MGMLLGQVKFQRLSGWQAPHCLTCDLPAVQEAHLYHERGSSFIRCCSTLVCRARAVLMAAEIYEANKKPLISLE
jgi:hypothetical protein